MKSLPPISGWSWWIAIALLSLLPMQVWAVEISVSVDRNPVSMNESFKIFFDAPDTPDGDPDFSPLDADFNVLNQGQSSSSSWINGQYSKSVRWTVAAMAKKSGTMQIPAINFGTDHSKPLPITVAPDGADDPNANKNQDLFLQVKATPEQPYVQSQVLYTVKLYRRVEIARAELNEPELNEAVVEKLGEDSNYNTVLNGVSYVVTERKYAIFPQKSGKLTIPPLTLNAQVVVDDPRGFGDFFGSQMTKTRRELSNEIVLNVKPASAKFTGKNWLPAQKLELAQTWSGDTQQMQVGEPLTRTLTLRGIGTTVGQLPELNSIKSEANIKAYPDQPVLNEQKTADGISATRQEKIALIPSVAGTQTLPAIEIPWFNTTTEKMEIARIPETTLNIKGGTPKPENTVTPEPAKPQTNSAETAKTPEKAAAPLTVNPSPVTATIWQWLALALGFGWISTLVYFLYYRGKSPANQSKPDEVKRENMTRLSEISKQLKTACRNNDSLGAKTALLAWGQQEFEAASLGLIATYCDARLRDEILELNRHLYSRDKSAWQGRNLFQAFSEANAGKQADKAEQVVLAPLHRL